MLTDINALLLLSLVLSAGVISGLVAKRFHLPSVTGQILAGILIGPAVLNLFDQHGTERLQPVTRFALGLIAVAVGNHLNLRRLRNAGRRLVYLLLLESTLTPVLVCVALLATPPSERDRHLEILASLARVVGSDWNIQQ